jgi:hypothetical protein
MELPDAAAEAARKDRREIFDMAESSLLLDKSAFGHHLPTLLDDSLPGA